MMMTIFSRARENTKNMQLAMAVHLLFLYTLFLVGTFTFFSLLVLSFSRCLILSLLIVDTFSSSFVLLFQLVCTVLQILTAVLRHGIEVHPYVLPLAV